jgi:hypothetical protein
MDSPEKKNFLCEVPKLYPRTTTIDCRQTGSYTLRKPGIAENLHGTALRINPISDRLCPGCNPWTIDT